MAHQDGRDIIPAPKEGCPGAVDPPKPCDPYWQYCEPDGSTQRKVTICHATGSETNPFVEITISENAVDAHRNHQDGEDIIPAPAGGCPGAAPKPYSPPDPPDPITVTNATKTSVTVSWPTPA